MSSPTYNNELLPEAGIFISELTDNPTDIVTRRIYADWLTDHNYLEAATYNYALARKHEIDVILDAEPDNWDLRKEYRAKCRAVGRVQLALAQTWMIKYKKHPVFNMALGCRHHNHWDWFLRNYIVYTTPRRDLRSATITERIFSYMSLDSTCSLSAHYDSRTSAEDNLATILHYLKSQT